MALVASVLPIKLGGINTKTDPRWLMPGDLVAVQNVRFDSWPELQKRWGTQQIGSAPAGALLASFKNELLVGTGQEAYSLASSGLVDKGTLESITVTARAVRRDAYAESSPDVAVHPLGISVYAWETSAGGAQYAVYDTATGQPIVSGATLGTSTAIKPKAFALGAYVVLLWFDTSTSHLKYMSIPAASPTSPSAAADFAIDAAAGSAAIYDATVVGGLQGSLVCTYANNGGSNRISVRALTAQLVLGASTVPTTTEAFNTCCAVWGDASSNVWIAYYTGAAVKVLVYDFALANVLLTFTTVDAIPGTVRNLTGICTGGTISRLYYEVTGSAAYNNLVTSATVNLSGGVSGVSTYARGVGLASKPFLYGTQVRILAAYQSTLQSTYFLLSSAANQTAGTTGKVVAKLAPGLGGGLTARSVLPEAPATSSGVYQTVYLQTTRVGVQTGKVFSQAGVMAASFDFSGKQNAVELSDNLHVSGGILSGYDGAQVAEHNFHLYPENLQLTAGGAGSLTGSVQAVAVYEWMDAQGLIHQSAPSPVATVQASSAAYLDYTVSALRLTSKSTPINVVFYRTNPNQSVFYRVTPINTPNLNSTSADTVSAPLHADTATDVSGNALLYSNPDNLNSEVPNLAPPAPLHLWRYRNRVCLIPAESPFQWVMSKAFVPGVPIEWNHQQLYQPAAQDGGPLTAGAEMDEKCILFTASRIYYVIGDGPAPNATSSDYGSAPQTIPTDVGCINRRSIVLTPHGLLFQSAKGIYLLGRDLSVAYVGAEVEAYNGATITAARMVPNTRRVMFYLNTGVALAWDYDARKWAVYTNQSAADACTFGGLATFVQPSGAILQETPGAYTDNGSPVLIGFTTSWLSFSGIAGLQRAYRLILSGKYKSAHVLQVRIAYDNNPAQIQTETVDSGALLGTGAVADTVLGDTENPGGGAFPALEYTVKLARQKCSSIQVSVQEQQLALPLGEGLSLSALTMLVGAMKGLHPTPAARSI